MPRTFYNNIIQPTATRREDQPKLAANTAVVDQDYGADHIPLGSEESAGMHRIIRLDPQDALPAPVAGVSAIFAYENDLVLQTEEGVNQSIPAPSVPNSYVTKVDPSSPVGQSKFVYTTAVTSLTGSAARQVTIAILPISSSYASAVFIPFATPFTKLLYSYSTTMPATAASGQRNAIFAPFLFNNVAPATPSINNIGAYLNGIIIYIDIAYLRSIIGGNAKLGTVVVGI